MRTITVLALLALMASAALAAPRTPSALVNGAERMAQVYENGPTELTFDVRSIGGAGIRVRLERWPFKPEVAPAREWRFDVDHGARKVKLNGLPIGIYRAVAVALDASGADLGAPSFPIYVEYGGWRAWDGVALEPDLRAGPPPFAGVGASYVPPVDLPRVDLAPATSVLKPGAEVELRATVRNLPADTEVRWVLDGPGSLDVDGARAKYTAPDTPDNEVARITVSCPGKIAGEGHATVLVTSVKLSQ